MRTYENFINNNLEELANEFLEKENISKDYLKNESDGLCWWFAKNFSKYLDSKGVNNTIFDMRSNKEGNHLVVNSNGNFIDFTLNQFQKSKVPAILKKSDYSMFSIFKEYENFEEFTKSWDLTEDEWIEYEKHLNHPNRS